jgi:uncharacterized protein (TIGR02186 family)
MKYLAIALFTLHQLTAPAAAQGVEIALTDDRVAVDTGFAGARLTLFGAVTGLDNPSSVDIISVIRGPEAQFNVRQFKKTSLIWTPGPTHLIENAPGLYITYATRPIDDIAPLPAQAEYRLDASFLDIGVTAHTSVSNNEEAQLFRSAFLTEAEDLGLYGSRVGGIQFKKGALFTINARLPANTPVGEYDVAVYLFRNGELIGSDSAALAVNRVGLERRVYDFAHDRPVSYGFFCVAMSLLAGWLASLAFRK